MDTLETVKSEFRRRLEEIYKVEFDLLKQPNPEDRVNEWVNRNTAGKIPKLYGKTFLDFNEKMLRNIIRFWRRQTRVRTMYVGSMDKNCPFRETWMEEARTELRIPIKFNLLNTHVS